MSWFASSAPTGPNIHPVQLNFPDQNALFGPLVQQDTEWQCSGGIGPTETQSYYHTQKDGSLVMVQIIYSSIGMWYPQIQFTFRYCNPKTNTNLFKSVSVSNFVTAPSAKLDKRSCKSDQFSITLDPATPNKYTIEGKFDNDVQVSLVYEAVTPGFKVGAGPKGGFTYFGQLNGKVTQGDAPDTAAGGDGYCIHRIWPRCKVSGILRIGKDVHDVEGSRGTFLHAIQGMRPNLLAAKWNFANFQSLEDDGVSLIMMEFTTPPAYGSKVINLGAVVVGDKLVSVTAGGSGVVGGSSATHENPIKDKETGYDAPSSIKYVWEGASLEGEGNQLQAVKGGKVHAVLTEDLVTDAEGYKTRGLVEKVDVLGHIPYLVRKFVNYAAGTKPYIYTWLNPVKASITLSNGTETKTIDAQGLVFSESTFISS
ncbi:hypothetical protein JCM5353_007078 [Sporobolomyces roseus]